MHCTKWIGFNFTNLCFSGMVEENADLIYNRVNRNPKFVSKQDFWQTVTLMINEHCNFSAKRDIKVFSDISIRF